MPAAEKIYRVKVRIVPMGAAAYNVVAPDVVARNSHDADRRAEAAVKREYPEARKARAVVAMSRKRIKVIA